MSPGDLLEFKKLCFVFQWGIVFMCLAASCIEWIHNYINLLLLQQRMGWWWWLAWMDRDHTIPIRWPPVLSAAGTDSHMTNPSWSIVFETFFWLFFFQFLIRMNFKLQRSKSNSWNLSSTRSIYTSAEHWISQYHHEAQAPFWHRVTDRWAPTWEPGAHGPVARLKLGRALFVVQGGSRAVW